MASGNIAQRNITRPATRPTVDELDHYLASHTLDQAARRWKVHPRTIQKWHARANAPQAAVLTQDERNTPSPIENTPTFSATADDVAGDHSMWRDPWTGELMPVPPGVHRHAWESERIAARDRHKAAVQAAYMTEAPTPENAKAFDTMSSQIDNNTLETETNDAEVDHAHALPTPHAHAAPLPNIALQSHETLTVGAPVYTSDYAPTPERVRVVRERVVIREREPVGLIAFVREHPGAAHQAVAWVIAAGLIAVASLG